MEDDTLDTYIEHTLNDLKKAKYSDEDIKKALDKIVVDSRDKKFFLVQYYIYSVILGMVFASLAVVSSIIISQTPMYFLILFLVFASLAYSLYFCFKFFDNEEKSILKVSISVSIIVSLYSYMIHWIVSSRVAEFFWINSKLTGDIVFSLPINIYALIILLLITYNVIPIIFFIKKKMEEKSIDLEEFSEEG